MSWLILSQRTRVSWNFFSLGEMVDFAWFFGEEVDRRVEEVDYWTKFVVKH